MIHRIFLLIFAIMIVGFAPALAQNIFVKPNKNASASDEKPSLFIKPNKSAATKRQSVVKYADKLKVRQLKLKSAAKGEMLAYWHEIGFKPSNAQEILMYADAHRAKAQEVMYKRREALRAYIQKKAARQPSDGQLIGEISSRRLSALGFDTQHDLQSAQPVQSAEVASEVGAEKPSAAKKKAAKIYVRKPSENTANPSKIFTGYR